MSGMIVGSMIEADSRMRQYEARVRIERRIARDRAKCRFQGSGGACRRVETLSERPVLRDKADLTLVLRTVCFRPALSRLEVRNQSSLKDLQLVGLPSEYENQYLQLTHRRDSLSDDRLLKPFEGTTSGMNEDLRCS